MALRTAFFALIAWEMSRLGVAASLLTVSHALKGEFASIMLIAPAAAALFLAVLSLREVATAIMSRRPPSGGY